MWTANAQELLKLPELETKSGKKYSAVTVTSKRPDGVSILHQSGTTRIAFEDLPEAVISSLGMNANEATAYREDARERARVEAAQKRAASALKSARLLFAAQVSQVVDGGAILKDVSYSDGTKEEKKTPYKVRTGGPSGLHPNAPVTYETRHRSDWVLKVRGFGDDVVFVKCRTKGMVDGDQYQGEVFDIGGTYSYTAVSGARRTIRSFITDKAEVLKAAGLDDDGLRK